MYLDKVEIHGFKSFANTVKLNIPKGITGVIGPNGSGKSNVSDAIRWVLGEQSAKSLRGSKMEDIIFAGTEKRKSLGYAEVILTIKNPDQKIAIDYNEIIVKRRAYRSGESEYFINGSPCRLRDIQELFMDTGVGKEGYSIIGQGQIDRVLSSKPEERRALFEEAAGIYKYKIRRIEAEKKLEKQRDNLTRLEDIIGEVETRIGPLSIEAEKTEQFLKLRDSLKEIDVNIFIYEIERLDKEIKVVNDQLTSIEEEIKTNQVVDEEKTLSYETLKSQRQQLYKETESLIEAFALLEKEKQKKQGQIEINNEKVKSIKRLLEKVVLDTKQAAKDHKGQEEKLAFLQTKYTALALEKASQELIIDQDEKQVKEMLGQVQQATHEMNEAKNALYEKMREIDHFKAETEKNRAMSEQFIYRKEQIAVKVQELNDKILHEEADSMLLEKKQLESQSILERFTHDMESVLSEKEHYVNEQVQVEKELATIEQNKIQSERQLKWLRHIKEENEGLYSSVKQVLAVAKANQENWQGIIGVVGELLQVPKDYEIAIVTALGASIQHIVTKKEQDARQMIQEMKKKGIARVTFLPLDTIKSGFSIRESNLSKEEGYLGLASELVTFDKQYERIMTSLLGRIIVVDEMKNASRIAKTYQYKYKIVTLEGEVFNSGGSLSGGSTKNQANNIFSRARELKETEQRVTDLIKVQREKQDKKVQLLDCLKQIKFKLDEIQREQTRKQEEVKQFTLQLEKSKQTIKLMKDSQLQIINERNNIEESVESIIKQKKEAEQKAEQLKKGLETFKEKIATLEIQVVEANKEQQDIEKALTDKRISFSKTVQNSQYIKEQITQLEEELSKYEEKNKQLTKMMCDYEEEIQELKEQNTQIKDQILQDEKAIQLSGKQRKEIEQAKQQAEIREKQMLEAINQIKEKMSLLKEEKYRLETKKESMVTQKQNWGSNMWEQYELTFNHALSLRKEKVNIAELKKQALDIRGRIKQMGNINVNAVEDYEETKKRYEFLTSQKEDIEKAALSLQTMITQMMTQMEEIFRVQFAIIAKNFSEVFKELFGGGEAYLELIDEEDILTSGINIIAKPPGKKLQNMTLLSGGERALTAISLIFGILKLKPSPFCVLDEIEAALDDANVIRFANYLEHLSAQMQFVVITHRKGTMERANTLYGVTMQEKGVSNVLSIQLEEVEQYIDKKAIN